MSKKGFPGTSIYSSTKAAVRSFGRTLAGELAPRGMRVNTFSPGSIATPRYVKLGMAADAAQKFEKSMEQSVALKRFGQAEEVARGIVSGVGGFFVCCRDGDLRRRWFCGTLISKGGLCLR